MDISPIDLIKYIEGITFQYINQIYPGKKKQRVMSYMIQKAKKDTFKLLNRRYVFTHMAVIGNLCTNGDLVCSRHNDRDDFITVLFHIGQPLYGGGTNYYTGLTSHEYGTLTKNIPCQLGRLTIGCFDKIAHSGEACEGSCGCINFNLKKSA